MESSSFSLTEQKFEIGQTKYGPFPIIKVKYIYNRQFGKYMKWKIKNHSRVQQQRETCFVVGYF